ncbi:hypothetical protein KSZ_78640 [Dictyobacter formicarum]|uniref:ABC3 transporter permease protein domain-containing protein n=2 Tax=Dictyobacter formicarum TaxID=2778368 RepID=A0ABQ3VWA6_9CHLR|nr:hypothetical protein KSZ_78640 [Dictyobacter formicarum]
MYPTGNTFILISFAEYQAASASVPVTYDSINITTQDQAHTNQAIQAIQRQVQQGHFPLVTVQTVNSIQRQSQVSTDRETQLQELAGLLALLIGGLGILNTMRVLLSRRTIEIAMLKTAGYSWRTLACFFGVETGIIGLIGGVIGTGIALGISYGIVTTILAIPFQPDLLTIGGGIILGAITALGFGLLPIVQSAAIRPIQVMREHQSRGPTITRKRTLILYCFILLFFCLLAGIILRNGLLACASVCGTVVFLLFLGLCFRPIIWGISLIHLSEQYSATYLIVLLICIAASALVCVFIPVIGGIVLGLLIIVLLIKWLPHNWKINTMMALRNIGRSPTRTTMLMLLLFVGIFVIGSIQMIGQDLQSQLAMSMNQSLSSNIVVKIPQNQTGTMQAQLRKVPNLRSSQATIIGATTPVEINGQPWQSLISRAENNDASATGIFSFRQALRNFDGVEGYDLADKQVPDSHTFQIMAGRNLNASDAQTHNALIPYAPAQNNALSLTIGSTVTVADTDGKTRSTLTIVGEYMTSGISIAHVAPILTSQNVVRALAPTTEQAIFYLKVDPAKLAQAEASIKNAIPAVAFVQTPASNADGYLQVVSTITLLFTVLASFVLLSGMVIMANAIVLDLLERRRELGILKAIGYTQKILQGEILLEYGIIGGLSALLAILLITLLTNFLGNIFLNVTSSNLGVNGATVPFTFSTNTVLLIGLFAGAVLLVLITSLFACWRTVRIRPLDVLRYE